MMERVLSWALSITLAVLLSIVAYQALSGPAPNAIFGMIALRSGIHAVEPWGRYAVCALQLLAAVPVVVFGNPLLAVPVFFSGAIHALELMRLSSAENVRERLQRVGFRMLAISLAHMALAILVLWPLAQK